MPQLPAQKTTKVYLPSTDKPDIDDSQKIWIEYAEQLKIGDLLSYDDTATELENGLRILSSLIKSWNLTDESDNTLPINPINIGLLPSTDLSLLLEIVTKAMPTELGIPLEQKKT